MGVSIKIKTSTSVKSADWQIETPRLTPKNQDTFELIFLKMDFDEDQTQNEWKVFIENWLFC